MCLQHPPKRYQDACTQHLFASQGVLVTGFAEVCKRFAVVLVETELPKVVLSEQLKGTAHNCVGIVAIPCAPSGSHHRPKVVAVIKPVELVPRSQEALEAAHSHSSCTICGSVRVMVTPRPSALQGGGWTPWSNGSPCRCQCRSRGGSTSSGSGPCRCDPRDEAHMARSCVG
jgi:hypothetical protein